MRVHLVDGTFELFRHFYGGPPRSDGSREARGAVAGVIQTLIGMLEGGATHIGVATDHVIESFRNDLYPGYKTGEGIDPQLREQFVPLEEAVATLGVAIWPMVEVEADDALAAVAASAASDARVEQVIIYTPDKDLAQCVRGERVVQFDRRSRSVLNADAVVAKFGVPPLSIPDYLALTGDSSDGFPGLPGWGSKSASAVLSRYGRLEDIPASPRTVERCDPLSDARNAPDGSARRDGGGSRISPPDARIRGARGKLGPSRALRSGQSSRRGQVMKGQFVHGVAEIMLVLNLMHPRALSPELLRSSDCSLAQEEHDARTRFSLPCISCPALGSGHFRLFRQDHIARIRDAELEDDGRPGRVPGGESRDHPGLGSPRIPRAGGTCSARIQ